MSDDLLARLDVGVRRLDRKAADNNTAERALAKEAAARILALEAELAALREARGVATGCLQKQLTHLQLWLSKNEVFLEESCVETFVYGDLLHAIRILAALEPAPVTPAEAARERIAIAIYEVECKADLYPECCPNWSDFPDHQWKWYAKADAALRALADAGEAGNV